MEVCSKMEGYRRKKLYVNALVLHTDDGRVRPREIIFADGRKFEIDKILDCKRMASSRAGGIGMCYRIRVNGRETLLFDEENGKWFVEAKQCS